MNDNVLCKILSLSYIVFGIVVLILPELGSNILESIPWRQNGIFNSKLVSKKQKVTSPFIVRLLGVACILLGLWLVLYYY